MAVQAIQKFVYRNLVQKPKVNRVLDGFGNRLNRAFEKFGLPFRYATGLTRYKAILFASENLDEVAKASGELYVFGSSGKKRAQRAIVRALSECTAKEGPPKVIIKLEDENDNVQFKVFNLNEYLRKNEDF